VRKLKVTYDKQGCGLTFYIEQFGWGYRAFINAIKREIPPEGRAYFPKEKRWYIHPAYVDKFMAIYNRMFQNPNQKKLF